MTQLNLHKNDQHGGWNQRKDGQCGKLSTEVEEATERKSTDSGVLKGALQKT